MSDILIRPEVTLERNDSKKWFINQELYTESNIFNQQFLEYLAKFLFNLPSSTSFLVKVKSRKGKEMNTPFFYDQKDRRYVLVTDILHKEDSIDLVKVYNSYEDGSLNSKLNSLHRLSDSAEEYLNLKEEMIKLTLFDFFAGQYGRGFMGDVYLSKTNGLHISAIYGFGNSYSFDETQREKETCNSVFGMLSLSELFQLVNSSKYRNFYLTMLSKLNFPYVLECFYKNSIIEMDSERKDEYIDYAREKQSILARISK